ncbi:MAG: hypothetical protein II705_00295 [Clostridia bacterium]|nr:hypothetical protein [Clostridia bacterium]
MNRPLIFILPAVLCLALIWALFPVQKESPSPSSYEDKTFVSASADNAAARAYTTAVIRGGRLCFVSPDTGEVERVLDVNVKTLPPADRERFSSGVMLYSKEDAARLVEDYTSYRLTASIHITASRMDFPVLSVLSKKRTHVFR